MPPKNNDVLTSYYCSNIPSLSNTSSSTTITTNQLSYDYITVSNKTEPVKPYELTIRGTCSDEVKKIVEQSTDGLSVHYVIKDEKASEKMKNTYVPPKYRPKKILYNNPATIVFWEDGTKTIVKNAAGNKFNKYNAFTAALAKKIFGNNSRVNKQVASVIDQTEKISGLCYICIKEGSEMKCPSCGASLSVNSDRDILFCPHCGAELPDERVRINKHFKEEHVEKNININKHEYKEEKDHAMMIIMIFCGIGLALPILAVVLKVLFS